MKKLIIVVGQPEEKSLAFSNAQALQKSAEKQGLEVELIRASDYPWINHNPTAKEHQFPAEFQEITDKLTEAEFMAFTAPVWNCAVPPILTNFILGVTQPDKFFRFTKEGKLEKLLKTEKVLVVWTSGAPAFVYKFLAGNPIMKHLKNAFKWCGAKKVDQLCLGGIHGNNSSKEQASIKAFIQKLENYKF